MTGPGKRDDELRAAVAAGIRAVTVESPGELARLEAIAATAGARPAGPAPCGGLRATPGSNGSGWSATTARASSGWTRADLVASAARAVASPHLELLGLHAFGASNVLDAGALVEHVAATVRAAAPAGARRPGSTLRLVDAGGGLGIPYEPHEASLDLARLGAGLAAIIARLGRRPAPARRPAAARARPVPRRAGRRLPRAGRRPQDRRRLDRGHPRRRRPSRAAAGAGRPGAPDPGVRGDAGRDRPGWRSDGPGDRRRVRCARGSTSSVRPP